MSIRHLYIHIPFCKSRCPYCDFYTVNNNPQQQADYTAALLKELIFFRSKLAAPLESIYFGGGTPSLLADDHLKSIFDFLTGLQWSKDIEITLEANPLTIDAGKCSLYRKLGINRVSLGTQSFVDSELKTLGRQHRSADALFAFNCLRQAGFSNINLDLLIGIPGQTVDSLQHSLEQLVTLAPEHISPYVLTYYENTVYTRLASQGRIQAVGDEMEAELFDRTADFLASHDYRRYEISNFSRPGYYSRHNMNTWRFGEYLGVGCAAHSFFDRQRRANPESLTAYLTLAADNSWLDYNTSLTRNDEIGEYVMLAFRTAEGVDTADFKEHFGIDFNTFFAGTILKHSTGDLLIARGSRICLSRKGFDLFNCIVADFLPD